MPLAMFTGGGSWFVREASRNLIADGWTVAISDLNLDAVQETAQQLNAGDAVIVDRLDVTDRLAVRSYVDDLAQKHGSVDALVNVAGGTNWLRQGRPPFHETDPDNWDKILKPNIYGVLNCCHAVIPHMIKAKRGNIINISSGMGIRGKGTMALYSYAKGGVVNFTHALCQELGKYNIRVNSIAPGSAESRWMPDINSAGGGVALPPIGSRTSAKDVGDAIQFLISDKARHITGICLDLSGGSSLH